ncbi:ABC transporter B family member 15-like [Andrographis paniculata]|uniref:ABC transporter B family member 15-like n=1 Tax=Andrographis paniculata TaxID=175694 RepID=UPI0021E90C99|nr:ABC transporter B family member 15-like [Andrographis paniculata]
MGMGTNGGLFRWADRIDKLLMFLGALASVGEGLAGPLSMYVLSGAMDAFGRADQSIPQEVVNKYGLKLLYVALGVGFGSFFEGLCWTRTAERQTSRIRIMYLKSVLRQEVGFFDCQDGTSSSSATFQVVSSISTDAHSIQDVITDKVPNSLAQFSALVFSLLVAFLLSWRIALASLPFAVGFVAPAVGFGRLMMDMGIQSKEAYGVAGSIAEQAISNIRSVYSHVGEHKTVGKFRRALEGSMTLGIKQGLMKGLMIGSMGMIFVTWAFQSWVGGLLVAELGESGGHVFIAGLSIILGGLSSMSALPNVPFIIEASAAAKRIYEIIDRIPEIDPENDAGKVCANLRGQIEFREVHFSYPSRKDEPVLQGLNLKVKPGEKVGLVGGSGSGKSTVIALLERFYDPVKGDILLDGHRIRRLQLKWYRSQFGLVNQEPLLFAASIKQNIMFGKTDASLELIVSAAKAANAHDFIVEFPQGYDTQVGQLGVQLSGGQKQRIAIARALLRDPRILLLDEATSALDTKSESIVQEAIDQASRGRTAVLITHRLSTMRCVDKIMVLESGKIVESGTRDELLRMQTTGSEGGFYRRLVRLQQLQKSGGVDEHLPEEASCPKEMMTHRSPIISSSLHNNSPASPLTPALPMSLLSTIQNSPNSSFSASHHNDMDEKSDALASPAAPSQWRLLEMNAPEWKRALLGCLGAVSFGAVMPVNAYCVGNLVSAYFGDSSSKMKSETRFYSVIFLSIAVIAFLSNLLQHYNFAVMGERLTKQVREKVLENVLTFEVGWFDEEENTSGAVCARLSTEANLVRSLVGDRMSLLVQVSANALLSFALGLIVAWRVAAVMIAIQPLVVVSFYLKAGLMKQMSADAGRVQDEGSQLASEAVVNHRTITAFSSEQRVLELFEATLKGPREHSVRQSWVSGVGLLSSQVLALGAVALTFWYGGTLMGKGLLTAKQLFVAFFILMSTGKTIADAGAMTSDLSKGSSAVRSVVATLDRKSRIDPDSPHGLRVRDRLAGKIELADVYFSYPSRPGRMIFQGLSLRIEAGERMALVGESGCGKSTALGLIERFYDPTKGSVLIDEHDVRSYNLRNLRSHIAMVSQEPVLFAGTIHENIAYGRGEGEGDATEAEVVEAARLANAHEFISSMKDGYRTYCGERGVQLSGGQKQRVALARAVLKNPSILVLDEATSALDSVSESVVQEALDRAMVGRTCVAVAHNLRTVRRMAGCIAVIRRGKVVEQGSHAELLALGQNGAYHALVKLQAAGAHSLAEAEAEAEAGTNP